MSNSRRWREFVTWFEDLEPTGYKDAYSLHSEIKHKISDIRTQYQKRATENDSGKLTNHKQHGMREYETNTI